MGESQALIFDAWYELFPRNFLVIPAPPEPGEYILNYGVYARSQINVEYPPFYAHTCKVTVR